MGKWYCVGCEPFVRGELITKIGAFEPCPFCCGWRRVRRTEV